MAKPRDLQFVHGPRPLSMLMAAATLALLSGCGGGGGEASTSAGTANASAVSVSAEQALAVSVTPAYHLAHVLPAEPDNVDGDGRESSAQREATAIQMDAALLNISTARALANELPQRRVQALAGTKPSASASVTFYSPAQIRAAYGFANLPAATVASKGASQGSGQLIAIINANHNPTIAADLATFSTKFGLPACAVVTTTQALISSGKPVAKPVAGSGCSFQVLYAASNGTATTVAPAVDKGWATEIALDVQWAHAIAPMASIVLIETPNSGSMTAGLALARQIGATVVSMSWGAPEFSGQDKLDSYFSTAGVSYVASTGDAGYQVNWPAVSAQVLAIGGTELSVSGSTRLETGWSGSGGGVSTYTAAPSWQSSAKALAGGKRAVPDVAYNASPSSAVYVYMTPSSTTGGAGWMGAAGTSAGTPQWAGLAAIVNATRALNGKATLSGLPAFVYQNVANRPGILATTLKDITSGSNGSCTRCSARSGFDLVTGLGSPNADLLSSYLAAQ